MPVLEVTEPLHEDLDLDPQLQISFPPERPPENQLSLAELLDK